MTSLKNTWGELRKFTKKEDTGRKGECEETCVPVYIGNSVWFNSLLAINMLGNWKRPRKT